MNKHFIPEVNRNDPKQKKGSVLVVVVLILMLVSLWVLGFTQQTLSLQKEMRSEQERKRAYQAALAGLEYSLFLLETEKGEQFDGAHSLENAEFRYQVRNEEGKWDLNSLVDGDGNLVSSQANGISRFLVIAGLKENPKKWINHFADWMDADATPRDEGREVYSTYSARNALLESFDEMLLVLEDQKELSSLFRAGCTLYSMGKINLNSAPPFVLASLSDKMNEPVVRKIVDYRNQRRFHSVEELKNIQGMSGAIYRDIEEKLVVQGLYYSVASEGKSGRSVARVGAIVKREENQFKTVWFQKDLNNENFLAWH